ncbi:MAG: hypothetical protein KDM64_10445 [Verrucomicrobiae bacterium]|nr:hypothetical protein [Verrucomicrobiae bacterium]
MKASHRFCLVLALFSLHQAAKGQDSYWDNAYAGGGAADGGATKSSGGGLFGASQFSYGYFDFGYFVHTFDAEVLDDANGFAGALSIPLADSLYVKAALGFAHPEDQDGKEIDYVAWDLGGGIGLPIGSSAFDIVLEAGIAHRKLGDGAFEDPIDGYGFYVMPGVRWGLGEVIELNGGVTFLNVDSDGNVAVDVKALLHLTPSVSLFAEGSFAEEVNQYGVGLRLSF